MEFPQAIEFLLYGVLALFIVGTILSGSFQVQTAQAAVIQRMGKFNRVATGGINFKLPWLDRSRGDYEIKIFAKNGRFPWTI